MNAAEWVEERDGTMGLINGPHEKLVHAAVNERDAAALAQLLVRAHDELLQQIRRQMPMDLERLIDAEDVLAETFTRAFQHIHELRSATEPAFASWLSQIARNCLRNIAKANRTAKRGGGRVAVTGAAAVDANNEEFATDILQMLARNSKSPRSIVGNREYVGLIRAAVEQLEPGHREVLRLRFIEDLPHGQIARRLGRSEAAVRQLCLRALRQLRALLPLSSTDGAAA